jgi:murein DD-endopeptidase MepM/ murein hydrolase activator NlpD
VTRLLSAGRALTKTNGRRAVALALVSTMFLGGLAAMAQATSSVDAAMSLRKDLRVRIDTIHATRQLHRVAIHQKIRLEKARLASIQRVARVGQSPKLKKVRARQHRKIVLLLKREHALLHKMRAHVKALKAQRAQLATWLDTYAVLRFCPVQSPTSMSNDFGAMVRIPGVPVHVHQGNDIAAAYGSPIVAPFDGTAVAVSSDLGGQGVEVYGAAGHVYNAHLSAYGQLGPVTAGTIIGYIGTTGDATSPHDHFEWHPGDGPAVDPHDLLLSVC